MKRRTFAGFALIFSFLFSFSNRTAEVVSANSAAKITWGTDVNGVVSRSENCPLEVKGEKLNFYIPSFPILPDQPSGEAYVSAEYTFSNPTDLEIDAELVFPFGTVPDYMSDYEDLSDFDIRIDGEVIEKQLRYTYYSGYRSFDLDRDMAKIRDEMTEDEFFRKNAKVFHYQIEFLFDSSETGLSSRRVVTFPFDPIATGLIAPAHYSSERKTVSLWVEKDKIYDFYFVGEDGANFPDTMTFYEDFTESMPSDGTVSLLAREEILFEDVVFKYYDESGTISRIDWNNAFYDLIESKKTDTERIVYLDEPSLDLSRSHRLLRWYDYRLNLQPGESAINEVCAPLYPSILSRYEPEKYEYTYLLSPAKSWADFQNLDIYVHTDFYLTDSSLNLTRNEDGTGYFAHLDDLPETELSFCLCRVSNPKIVRDYWFLDVIIIVAIVLLAAALILAVVPTVILIIRMLARRGEFDCAIKWIHLGECVISLIYMIAVIFSALTYSDEIFFFLMIPYFLILFALLLVEDRKFHFSVLNRMLLLFAIAFAMAFDVLRFDFGGFATFFFASAFAQITAVKSLKAKEEALRSDGRKEKDR